MTHSNSSHIRVLVSEMVSNSILSKNDRKMTHSNSSLIRVIVSNPISKSVSCEMIPEMIPNECEIYF